MGVRTPETCWAVNKCQVINWIDCCIWLVDLFEKYGDRQTYKTLNFCTYCIFDRGVIDTVSGESSHSWEDGTAPPYHAGKKSSSSGSPWSSLSPVHSDSVVSKVRVPLHPTEPCRRPRVWCRISWYPWRWANGHCWISNRWTARLRVKSAWTSCGLTKPNKDSQYDESLRVDDPS